MALKLVRTPKGYLPSRPPKSRDEYLVTCLSEEANDPKFTDWERSFIISLSRQLGGRKRLSQKQKEILQRLWKK